VAIIDTDHIWPDVQGMLLRFLLRNAQPTSGQAKKPCSTQARNDDKPCVLVWVWCRVYAAMRFRIARQIPGASPTKQQSKAPAPNAALHMASSGA
jgi:hypothetical protein